MTHLQFREAALINIGNNPIVSLIGVILAAGIIVFVVNWLMDAFGKAFIAEPFASGIKTLVLIVCCIWVLVVALDVIFGIQLFSGAGTHS